MENLFRMLKRNTGIVLFVILLLVSSTAELGYVSTSKKVSVNIKTVKVQELTLAQKLEDFNYMYDIFKDNYPYFELEKRTFGYDWLGHKSEFEEWIEETTNNTEFYNTMDKIAMLIQNGHTQLMSPDTFNKFQEIYKNDSPSAWRDVILNNAVTEHYKYWEKNINYDTKYIPMIFKYIEGNYIVCDDLTKGGNILNKYNIPVGSILLKVQGQTADEYVESLIDRENLLYDFKRKKIKLNELLIFSDDGLPIRLTLKTPEGEIIEPNISDIQYISSADYEEDESNYKTAILEPNKAAYIKVNSFCQQYVDKDAKGIHNFFSSIKDYPNLIIDVRGNGGGSFEYWINNIISPLINKPLDMSYYVGFRESEYTRSYLEEILRGNKLTALKELPDSINCPGEVSSLLNCFIKDRLRVIPRHNVGFKGKIYILVDDDVYSSAESFVSFAKSTGWATLIGTTTGGDGLGYDPVYAALPNSGLLIRFPFDMGFNPDGTINEETHTQPDIYVEQTCKDFMEYIDGLQNGEIAGRTNSYDTVLNTVFEIIEQ